MMDIPQIRLSACPKGWANDLDKAISPLQTIKNVAAKLGATELDIVADVRRIDAGRLGIPVYLGLCGSYARGVMPVRKQMGKGSSGEQAHASALMELMERFAFFTFWRERRHMVRASWRHAEKLFGADLVPVEEILLAVNDQMSAEQARNILDLLQWDFYPATNLASGRATWLPLDWFRMLGEYNGSSAGNTAEESLLQGLCELVERHVSCMAARGRLELPTIRPESCKDQTLAGLLAAFGREGINIVLKDMSLGMPLPTVAALAWDPATFPAASEIVFTAGTASSPVKAAIRAVTEVAQLGGDFCTHSCYEASGLPKITDLAGCAWILAGPETELSALPDIANEDIRAELLKAVELLRPLNVYGIETTHPDLGVPAHYCIVPGLQFLERDRNQSLGLFVGRKLAEDADFPHAARGLAILAEYCPNAHYNQFFQGILALRMGDNEKASASFLQAVPAQPDEESRALALFYAGYARTLAEDWAGAIPLLAKAVEANPLIKEYPSRLGVALFRTGDYARAEECFEDALKIDKGSAVDLANRGLCRKFQGKMAAAAEDLRTALELEPGLDFARAQLAEIEVGLD